MQSDAVKSLEGEFNQKEVGNSLDGKKIVLVEDDQFLEEIITRKLANTKCVLFHASEGEKALEIISRELPDIVMLDIILPGIDGFEILRRIKSNPEIKNIPVILLSNLGQEGDIEKGKSLGANRFLIKATVTPDEIVSQIEGVLSGVKK
ncbi:MAG: response regulator [Parcubacteria group bacterium CG11_big_fil_rev_8_21_14_0_20_39_22]|nr:MAG: response regulator [Parcubacteria group bacterium CG11_big_fil_rev_8_21_14_0_20_39_22]